VSTASVANTGANANCVSNWGANDMVGNLWEWVADWDESTFIAACFFENSNWPAGFGSDFSCLGRGSGEASTRFPGALIRGGSFNEGTSAGPFAVDGILRPSFSDVTIGLRGARY
jgi:formylglycine-generating enzyme required for sulfatase activity